MINLTMSMKDAFFDAKPIVSAVDRETRGAISKSLSYVRKVQRNSLRRRKRPSQPGEKPSVHSSDPTATLKNILFAYDARTKSGIVGMVYLNQKQENWIEAGSLTVPQIMESGGVVVIHEQATERSLERLGPKAWRRRDRRRSARTDERYRKRRAIYRPRPSAGPALEVALEQGKILSPWANVVSG